MGAFLDRPGAIRVGDELNTTAVDAYMRDTIKGLEGPLRIKQFEGGASNLTYQLDYDNRQFVLRRPPRGYIAKNAHDMGREYKVMKALQGHFPEVPRVLDFVEDSQILGAQFYIMEKVSGIILRQDYPQNFHLAPEQARQLNLNFVEVLARLHTIDYHACGLVDLGRPEGYGRRQIEGWYRRYNDAHTDDGVDLEPVYRWLSNHLPEQSRSGLIHNDYRFDNVILDEQSPERILGVLDWEMCTLGDPLMDLGNTLGYWITADDPEPLHRLRRQPCHRQGMLSRQEFCDYYSEVSGIPVTNIDYYLVYSYFRMIGVIQQLYFRYRSGKTSDTRFADAPEITRLYLGLCRDIMETS